MSHDDYANVSDADSQFRDKTIIILTRNINQNYQVLQKAQDLLMPDSHPFKIEAFKFNGDIKFQGNLTLQHLNLSCN